MRNKFIFPLILSLVFVLSTSIYLYNVSYSKYEKNEKEIESLYEQKVSKIVEEQNNAQEEINKIVEEGQINVSYSVGAIFEGKNSKVFKVRNIEQNHGDIIFKIYDSEGNIIFESQPLSRGYECNEITLNKELKKGKHECRISINYINDGNVKSTFPITIEVL